MVRTSKNKLLIFCLALFFVFLGNACNTPDQKLVRHAPEAVFEYTICPVMGDPVKIIASYERTWLVQEVFDGQKTPLIELLCFDLRHSDNCIGDRVFKGLVNHYSKRRIKTETETEQEGNK